MRAAKPEPESAQEQVLDFRCKIRRRNDYLEEAESLAAQKRFVRHLKTWPDWADFLRFVAKDAPDSAVMDFRFGAAQAERELD